MDDGGLGTQVLVLLDPRLLVHGHQDVGLVALGHHTAEPQAGLVHHLAAADLSRIGLEAVDLEPGPGSNAGEKVAEGDRALASFAAYAHDNGWIDSLHSPHS